MPEFFPLPYLENRMPKPLPGFRAIKTPSNRIRTKARSDEHQWGDIVDRAKSRFNQWLPGGSWWKKNEQEGCAENGFIELFKEAIEIPIKIETDLEIERWCQKLFKQPCEPESWICRIKRDSSSLASEVIFSPVLIETSDAISPFPKVKPLDVTFQSPHLHNYKLIAINQNLKKLCREYPIIARHTAFLLKDLAEQIESRARKTDVRKHLLHQSALISILYSWWAKRGGSDKKFPDFAAQLDLVERDSLTESFAKQARKRLNPQTICNLQIIKRQGRDAGTLKKFLGM